MRQQVLLRPHRLLRQNLLPLQIMYLVRPPTQLKNPSH